MRAAVAIERRALRKRARAPSVRHRRLVVVVIETRRHSTSFDECAPTLTVVAVIAIAAVVVVEQPADNRRGSCRRESGANEQMSR